jgi:RND family efflux transporter MFP subunit
MKKTIALVLMVALIAGGTFWWWSRKSADDAKLKEAPKTATVERGPVRLVVSSSGRIVSNLDVEIKCKASGEIVRLPRDVSDPVRRGDLLLELNPLEMQRQVNQSQASLAASAAKLVNARENLIIAQQNLATDRLRYAASLKAAEAKAADSQARAGRVKELLDQRLASLEEYDSARTVAVQAASDLDLAKVRNEELKTQEHALELSRQQIRIAEAQVESDRIALDLAQERLADTRVTSPIDGVLTARNVQIGQIISSGISNVGGGTTAMTVSDLSHIFVLAAVDEADIGKVAVEQPVEITVDAFPGKRFEGRVVRIATRGVNSSNVITFEVKIEVSSREKELLRPEMTANVDIIAAARDNVLSVPAESIVRRQGKPHVTLVGSDGAQDDRPVETGISDGQKTEVISGISEGQTVVVYNGGNSKFNGQQRRGPPRMMGIH